MGKHPESDFGDRWMLRIFNRKSGWSHAERDFLRSPDEHKRWRDRGDAQPWNDRWDRSSFKAWQQQDGCFTGAAKWDWLKVCGIKQKKRKKGELTNWVDSTGTMNKQRAREHEKALIDTRARNHAGNICVWWNLETRHQLLILFHSQIDNDYV